MTAPTRRSSVGLLPRLVPIAGWLPKYERRWLRGDIFAGIAVTAMIVPKDLGYAGIAGVPVQNGLYAAAAGAIIYALFCTSRQISTGPSSSLAAVAGERGARDRPRRRAGGAVGRGDRARHRRVVPVARRVADGLDLAVSLEGGRDRLLGGRGGSGRHRRAPEADRYVRRRRLVVAGAGVVDPRSGRHPLDDGRSSASSRSR